MGARTGDQYLAQLRQNDREIWLGGERVDDVADHPAFRGGAEAIAAYFDLQFELPDLLLVADPESGEQINISHVVPRCVDSLRRRGEGLRAIAERSVGVMGRTPDYMNVTFAGFADDRERWAGPEGRNTDGYEKLVAFQKRLRRDDLSLTHTIVNPTVDKATDNRIVGDPVPLHKVGETADSIVVRGARLLATLAPYADETAIYPGAPIPEGGEDYALAFTLDLDTPGLVFLCRDSGLRSDADPIDAPFSTRFDEQDALCIFDDVEVPKDNVWIDGDLEVYNTAMRGSWYPNVMQQTTLRALTKLEFSYGLACRMADAVNDTSPATLELLGEVLGYIEVVRSVLTAAEANATTYPSGAVFFEDRAIYPLRALLPEWMTRVNEIIKVIGGHNLLAVSSHGQLDDERLAGLVEEFVPGANGMTARERTETFRLAWDFVGSTVGSRGELYERYYLRSARSNRVSAQQTRSAATRQRGGELVDQLLDAARARSV